MNVVDVSMIKIKRKYAAWIKARLYGEMSYYMYVPDRPIELWPEKICNKKQFEMYKAIVDFKDQKKYAPTYQELVDITGRAIVTVQKRVKELETLGLIIWHGARAIEIIGETYIKPLPMFFIEDHPDKYEDITG